MCSSPYGQMLLKTISYQLVVCNPRAYSYLSLTNSDSAQLKCRVPIFYSLECFIPTGGKIPNVPRERWWGRSVLKALAEKTSESRVTRHGHLHWAAPWYSRLSPSSLGSHRMGLLPCLLLIPFLLGACHCPGWVCKCQLMSVQGRVSAITAFPPCRGSCAQTLTLKAHVHTVIRSLAWHEWEPAACLA